MVNIRTLTEAEDSDNAELMREITSILPLNL